MFSFLQDYENYSNLDVEKMQDARIPLLFLSFPSAKDPNWNLHPGRKDKSTCAIITLARWEWYEKWQNRPLKRRGDDYDAVNMGPIIYFMEDRSPSKDKQRFCISADASFLEGSTPLRLW